MKIIGNTVGTPTPRSNLKQTNPKKADYVIGKEILPTKVSQLENDSGYLTEHQDISGKLDANKLPEAINQALAQAKASGEFEGEPGADGKSIFFYPEEKKAKVEATFHITIIQKGDRNVSVGDLVLAASGWLYHITSISGNIAPASFLSILAVEGEGSEGASITVDSELSETSENPVQNKVITGVINEFGTTFEQTIQAISPRLNPVVATADNGKVLAVQNGAWSAVDASPMIAQVARAVVNNMFVSLTQAQYDALVSSGSVDANKYYMIVGDGA